MLPPSCTVAHIYLTNSYGRYAVHTQGTYPLRCPSKEVTEVFYTGRSVVDSDGGSSQSTLLWSAVYFNTSTLGPLVTCIMALGQVYCKQ